MHSVAGEGIVNRGADRGGGHGPTAFVAGPPPMVDATLRMLITDARLPATDIRYDKFT